MSSTYDVLVPNLELFIPDNSGLCTMNIQDISYYPEGWVVECPDLVITPPGFSDGVPIDIGDILFNKTITACDLGLQRENCDRCRMNLPDGIYLIRYSISPNDKLFVNYYHFRTAILRYKFHALLCCIDKKKLYDEDLKIVHSMINKILFNMEVLKLDCEFNHNIGEAMNLYKEIERDISKIACSFCDCSDISFPVGCGKDCV